jgi:hypothetical protein
VIVPEGATVSIGGTQVGEAPMSEPLVLMPGTVTVSFAAVGYQPKDVELKIEAGSESERKITLEPVPIVTKPDIIDEERPEPEPTPTDKGPNMLPIYIGGGATIGLTVAATITGIMAVGKHSTYVDTDPAITPVERADAQSSGKTLALVTDLCIVGAIGAAGFTAYWYIYKWKPKHDASKERPAEEAHRRPRRGNLAPKVGMAPWVQPQAGGLVLAGAF